MRNWLVLQDIKIAKHLSLPLATFLGEQILFLTYLQSQKWINDTSWTNHDVLSFKFCDPRMDKPVQPDSFPKVHSAFTEASKDTAYSSLIMKESKSKDLITELLVVLVFYKV